MFWSFFRFSKKKKQQNRFDMKVEDGKKNRYKTIIKSLHSKLIFTVYLGGREGGGEVRIRRGEIPYKMVFATRYELSLSTILNLQSREVFWRNQHSPGVPDAQFLSLSSHLPDPYIINDFLAGSVLNSWPSIDLIRLLRDTSQYQLRISYSNHSAIYFTIQKWPRDSFKINI